MSVSTSSTNNGPNVSYPFAKWNPKMCSLCCPHCGRPLMITYYRRVDHKPMFECTQNCVGEYDASGRFIRSTHSASDEDDTPFFDSFPSSSDDEFEAQWRRI